ncbi:MAG: NAD-dependent epimerase/dehydratase family protein [Clostridia bacterium]|nr:NAD-dependent epimerase/dehydratase family protein [Clostridia bacterium]
MAERKRVLLLGGTGTIGTHVAPELIRRGFSVVVTSRSAHASDGSGVEYRQGNAKDDVFLDALLSERFDAIIDFMIYSTDAFSARCETLLSHTDHYIFLSSYRVYGDTGCAPITEESPRLLDSVDDPEYLKTDEYGLAKARQENILNASGRKNYTIIRPSITYAGDRFQLGTMEANEFLVRALKGKTVVFPKEMLSKRAAMTWAGDVGKMIARLVLNEAAFGETYTAASAETVTWNNVLKIYQKILGMQVKYVPLSVYQSIVGRPWQIRYDRMLHRVIDNGKILRATGMKQSELMPLYEGLRIELQKFAAAPHFKNVDEAMQARFDRALIDPPKAQPKPAPKPEPKKGLLRRLNDYRKKGVLMKVVKKKLYKIAPLRKAVHGIKRIFKKS